MGKSEGGVRASEKTPSVADVKKNCIVGKCPQLRADTAFFAGVESCEQRAEAAFPKPAARSDHRPHSCCDMCEHCTACPRGLGEARGVGTFFLSSHWSTVLCDSQGTESPRKRRARLGSSLGCGVQLQLLFQPQSCWILWYTATAFFNTDKARSCASQNHPLTPEKGYWENICGWEKRPQSYLSTLSLLFAIPRITVFPEFWSQNDVKNRV